jgi:hypothetical protein
LGHTRTPGTVRPGLRIAGVAPVGSLLLGVFRLCEGDVGVATGIAFRSLPAPRPTSDSPGTGAAQGAVSEDVRRSYAEALGGRLRELTSRPPDSGLARRFPRLVAGANNALEFRSALRTGETLIIDTHRPFLVTPQGRPVGFGAGLFGTLVALVALLTMQRETKPLARLAARRRSGRPVCRSGAAAGNAPQCPGNPCRDRRLQ